MPDNNDIKKAAQEMMDNFNFVLPLYGTPEYKDKKLVASNCCVTAITITKTTILSIIQAVKELKPGELQEYLEYQLEVMETIRKELSSK